MCPIFLKITVKILSNKIIFKILYLSKVILIVILSFIFKWHANPQHQRGAWLTMNFSCAWMFCRDFFVVSIFPVVQSCQIYPCSVISAGFYYEEMFFSALNNFAWEFFSFLIPHIYVHSFLWHCQKVVFLCIILLFIFCPYVMEWSTFYILSFFFRLWYFERWYFRNIFCLSFSFWASSGWSDFWDSFFFWFWLSIWLYIPFRIKLLIKIQTYLNLSFFTHVVKHVLWLNSI